MAEQSSNRRGGVLVWCNVLGFFSTSSVEGAILAHKDSSNWTHAASGQFFTWCLPRSFSLLQQRIREQQRYPRAANPEPVDCKKDTEHEARTEN
eukprot:104129-Amphidinium_carterae.1